MNFLKSVMLRTPQATRLQSVYQALGEAIRQRTLIESTFRRLESQAIAASRGDGDLLEMFYRQVEAYQPAWLTAAQPTKVTKLPLRRASTAKATPRKVRSVLAAGPRKTAAKAAAKPAAKKAAAKK